jgi:hypothetical protein
MSSDLLEAFGTHGGSPSEAQSSTQATTHVANSSSGFDGMTATAHKNQPVSQDHSATVSRIEPIFRPGIAHGNDILFDADVDGQPNNDDDFGDFESVDGGRQDGPTTAATTRIDPVAQSGRHDEGQLIDLLDMDNHEASAPASVAKAIISDPRAFSGDLFAPIAAENELGPELKHRSTSAHFSAAEDDEGWGDFEDAEKLQNQTPPEAIKKPVPVPIATQIASPVGPVRVGAKQANQHHAPPASEADDIEEWDDFGDDTSTVIPNTTLKPTNMPASAFGSAAKASSIPKDAQRPTNVPPPAILLSLLPLSIAELVSQILSASARTPTSSQLLAYHRVACRLISTPARTLRWRRDTILAQSTRISVAGKMTSSGGVGAMKLSSVNKGESAREEREAAEAVEAWNKNLHQFSKTLAGSGVKLPPGIRLRLSMDIGVKPLNGGGAIQSTIICPLCGLKRNERTIGADDVGVEDVFGEFWLEDWGHSDCAEWWYRWKDDLSQR